MRIASGIILIVLGAFGLIGLTIGLSHFDINLYSLAVSLLRIVVDAFLVAGGVLCLTRRYWGLCLASALFALFIEVFTMVTPLPVGRFIMTWDILVLVIGAIISAIFISVTKGEWHETQDPVSYHTSQKRESE
jgi:hypothetical protein